MKNYSENSRRKWLSWSFWAGAGIITGAGFRGFFKKITHTKKRYISSDGTAYEVETSRFFKRKKKKVSNTELRSWIGDRY